MTPCRACNGTTWDCRRPCSYCRGTGRAHIDCPACADLHWRERQACAACAASGRVDVEQLAAVRASIAARPAPRPMTAAERAQLRACDGCTNPTRSPRLCPACEHAEHEARATDEAFNRARGRRIPRMPSRERREEPRTHAPRERAPSIPAPARVERIEEPATDVVESRIERDDEQIEAAARAFRGHEGAQTRRRRQAA